MTDKSKEQSKKSKDTSVTVAWIGAGATIIAALIGVFAIWVQPQKTDDITPTLTVAPTETGIPSTPTPEVLYMDEFSSGSSEWWSTDSVDNNYWFSSSSLSNGVYIWQVTAKQSVFASLISEIPSRTNFDLELSLERIDDSENSSYGITFFANETGGNGYDLKFEPKRPNQFKLQKRQDNATIPLIDFTEAPSMNPTGNNRIRILVVGSNIKIFINGVFAGEVNDDTIRKGQIGLFAGLFEGETVILNMSDFQVSVPPSQ